MTEYSSRTVAADCSRTYTQQAGRYSRQVYRQQVYSRLADTAGNHIGAAGELLASREIEYTAGRCSSD